MRGYARAIGHTTNVAVKRWALQDEINLCIELNLTNVLIELDAKLVVDRFLKGEAKAHGNDILRIQHYYREANKCVDAFTRRGVVLSQDFVIFYFPS